MIQVRGQRWWSSCRGGRASLAILSLAVVAGWTSESVGANGDASLPVVVRDSDAPRSLASFDELAGMEGGASMTPYAPIGAEGVIYDGEVEACGPAGRCQSACHRPGLFQGLHDHHRNACWVGRADALVLWRDAPPARPLVETGVLPPAPVLDANQLQSTATGGVRGSLLRVDGCCGNAWELTYIYAGNFTAQRNLPYVGDSAYALSPPGIYGNRDSQPFDVGAVSLLGRLQSAEFNRHLAWGPNFRWLAGFRWVQWHEQFALQDTLLNFDPPINDLYQTTCDNNLYGGQIGADARLFTLSWLRVDSVVKAGAYYNNAVQTSTYTTDDPATPGTATVTVGQSPAACSFVGEVGLTGVLPLTCNLDFRFGYFGLWLTGLSQPTQQLSGQQVTPGFPTVGTINANGGTLLQGVSLGLEGRW